MVFLYLLSFKKLLKYNPKYFSKNGFIQMIERLYKNGKFKDRRHSFHIYCTVCNSLVFIHENTVKCTNIYLNECIAKTAKRCSKNTKKRGRVSLLSSGKIDEIYLTYSIMYSKGLAYYNYNYLHEGRKRIVNHLINSTKVI